MTDGTRSRVAEFLLMAVIGGWYVEFVAKVTDDMSALSLVDYLQSPTIWALAILGVANGLVILLADEDRAVRRLRTAAEQRRRVLVNAIVSEFRAQSEDGVGRFEAVAEHVSNAIAVPRWAIILTRSTQFGAAIVLPVFMTWVGGQPGLGAVGVLSQAAAIGILMVWRSTESDLTVGSNVEHSA